MAAKIDQKAYLQKYLSGPSDKKKKKKKVVKGKGFKIIDDDLDLSKLQELQGDELDILDQGEDAPQIAGIIDERPEEVKKAELFKSSSKWRVVTQDDGINTKLQVEEIKRDIKEVEKENEVIFGKMYSDSEDEKKNDSDLSPPRKRDYDRHAAKKSSDSDLSPPRRKERNELSLHRNTGKGSKRQDNASSIKIRNGNDSNLSPPRKHSRRNQNQSDSDLSPPRKNIVGSSRNISMSEKNKERKSRWDYVNNKLKGNNSSTSPKRSNKSTKKRHNQSDSDSSPPRKSKKSRKKLSDSDASPPRKQKKKRYDVSPPRKERKDTQKSSNRYENGNHSRINDVSSIRDKKSKDKHKHRSDSNSDLSPPRNKRKHRKERNQSDSDLSPPRKNKRDEDSDLSPPRRDKRSYRNSDSPPPTNKKMAKTLEGKMAGLQDAKQLRQENEAFRQKEDEAYKRLTDDVSGRNAKAVSRKSKRETSEDRQKQKEKAERQKELDEKYKKWSKGLKQVEAQEERVQEYIREAAKPLARYKDDRDLEGKLREVERDGDPMLNYIRERKRERGELEPAKPTYKGNFPPNRYNIRPGYRWDGVDRSNGYEKKFFEQQSKRKALEEDAYKWSTEDL